MSSLQDKVAIVTDSVACLPPDVVDRHNLIIVPVNIFVGGKLYHDGIDLTANEAYALLESNPDGFASSPASVGDYVKAYREAASRTKSILCLTVSSKLSAMYNMALNARQEVQESPAHVSIEILDSRTAAVGQGLIVSAAAEAAEKGAGLADVLAVARGVKSRVKLAGVVDTMRYVHRTGRVPKVLARLLSVGNVKPVFVVSEGVLRVVGLFATRDDGIDTMLDGMRKTVGRCPVHVAVGHARAFEAADKLLERIRAEFQCVEIWLTELSPVIAFAAGPGVLAIAYYATE